MLRLLGLTLLGWLSTISVMAAEPLKAGDVAPDFTLSNADDKPVKLSAFRDQKPVVLLFSRAQWCPYCLGHMKAVQSRYADFRKAGAEVVAVFREDQAKVEGLQKVRTATKAEFVLLSDFRAEQTKAYSPEGYAAYVIDQKGVIRAIVPGTKAGRPDVDKLLESVTSLAGR
jgi:peroxiredoxin Q/BCP